MIIPIIKSHWRLDFDSKILVEKLISFAKQSFWIFKLIKNNLVIYLAIFEKWYQLAINCYETVLRSKEFHLIHQRSHRLLPPLSTMNYASKQSSSLHFSLQRYRLQGDRQQKRYLRLIRPIEKRVLRLKLVSRLSRLILHRFSKAIFSRALPNFVNFANKVVCCRNADLEQSGLLSHRYFDAQPIY